MSESTPRHLFDAFGIELEFMLVDARTLDVLPRTDELLKQVAGEVTSEVDLDGISWSNELVLHVVELKTTDPAERLEGLPGQFVQHIQRINALLEPLGGRLMPTAMHPWMDPARETVLWPHDYGEVYATYDRIFSCQGHGWSNLQSVHLNLPFGDDLEFGKLHAAIRLVLPLLPALAASSPVVEGRTTRFLDTRLDVYRTNSARVPSVSGQVIPEPVFSRQAYQREIFDHMYADIAPLDPDGVLQHEWLNARGAIARFDRQAIEIRVLDVQETPQADLAIVAATIAVLRALVAERWVSLDELQSWPVEPLERLLLATIAEADRAVVNDERLLRVFGWSGAAGCTTGELWAHLIEQLLGRPDGIDPTWEEPLRRIVHQGPLARRILHAVGPQPTRARLAEVYGRLCACLADGQMFDQPA